MTVKTREIKQVFKVSAEKLALWKEVLSVKEGHYPNAKKNTVIDTLSLNFGYGFATDLRLYNGNTPEVLFEASDEAEVPESKNTLLGDYCFSFFDRLYIAYVMAERIEDEVQVGKYLSVTTDDGDYVGVVSKVRGKSFDLHGFLLTATYSQYVTTDPRITDIPIYWDEVHDHGVPSFPLDHYLSSKFKVLQRKEEQENNGRVNGFTEDQLIDVLEDQGYRFFELGNFDKNLFYTIANDLYEYDEEKELWFEREESHEEDSYVYLCNDCDEMYEDELDVCEELGCEGSIRKVTKSDMGM